MVSDQAGRSNILARLREIGLEVDPKDPEASRALLEMVKEREFEGYAYDGAEASFELLARRALRHACRTTSRCRASASWTSGAGMRAAS